MKKYNLQRLQAQIFGLSLVFLSLSACQYEGWASEDCYILKEQTCQHLPSQDSCHCPDYVSIFALAGGSFEQAQTVNTMDPRQPPNNATTPDPVKNNNKKPKAKAQRQSAKSSAAQETDKSCIDLNQASEEELMSLPGIGKARAKTIIEARNRRPFKRKRELTRIKGIGPKSYKKLAAHLCEL